MRVAVPLFGMRVSPRCLYSDKTLLAQITDERVVSRRIVETIGMSEDERLSQLVDLEIDVYVCGAVDEEFIEKADSYGIKVIRDIAAEAEEVLTALASGRLRSGYGFTSGTEEESLSQNRGVISRDLECVSRSEDERLSIDCVECIDRICLKGESCTSQFGTLFPAGKYLGFQHSMEVTTDISAETERKLCRVAEFIYYCIGMEYKHVGVAFCVELFKEAEILTRLLRRFFKVTPVCCKIGGYARHDLITASRGVLCNPIGQARVLNNMKTDINASVGLCVGSDLIYTQHSDAPTSTLFVKDKSLANNPVSALYSKYYIDDILRAT